MSEAVRSGTNLKTWITLAGFALTIGSGVMLYGAERTENRLRHAEALRRIEMLEGADSRHAISIHAAQVAQAALGPEISSLRREIELLRGELGQIAGYIRNGGARP